MSFSSTLSAALIEEKVDKKMYGEVIASFSKRGRSCSTDLPEKPRESLLGQPGQTFPEKSVHQLCYANSREADYAGRVRGTLAPYLVSNSSLTCPDFRLAGWLLDARPSPVLWLLPCSSRQSIDLTGFQCSFKERFELITPVLSITGWFCVSPATDLVNGTVCFCFYLKL